MSVASSSLEPYNLAPDFEALVVYTAATSNSFWASIGRHLDSHCLASTMAKYVLDACKLIALGNDKKGPGSTLLVLQRLARRRNEGKITQETLLEISDYITEVESWVQEAKRLGTLPSEAMIIAELAPILKQRANGSAIELAATQYSTGGDLSAARAAFDAASKIGAPQATPDTTLLHIGALADIRSAGNFDKLSTGIFELDQEIKGGVPRGSLTVWLATSGAGKSQALVTGCATAALTKPFTGLVTLELPKYVQEARIFACLTGLEVDMILSNEKTQLEVERRFGIMMAGGVGQIAVVDMPPQATIVADIVNWIEEQEQITGQKMEAIYIDYADKMHAKTKDDSSYVRMGAVYEGLRRDIADQRKMWVFTASQAKAPQKGAKQLSLHDGADSQQKVRVADLVVSLNGDGEVNPTLMMKVLKYRHGVANKEIGPLPTDFERGRITPRAKEWTQW